MSIFLLLASDLNNNNIKESAGNTLTLTKDTLKEWATNNREALKMLGVDIQKAFIKLFKHISENEGQYNIRISTHWPNGKKGYHTMGDLKKVDDSSSTFDIFCFKKKGSKDVEKRIAKMNAATTVEETSMTMLIYILSGSENICNNPRPNLEEATDFFRSAPWIF